MTTYDADIPLYINVDVGDDLVFGLNQVNNTNTGELSEVVYEETQYGGYFCNIRMSVHVLLNQCVTLLTKSKYQIKGSSIHIFFYKYFLFPYVDYHFL